MVTVAVALHFCGTVGGTLCEEEKKGEMDHFMEEKGGKGGEKGGKLREDEKRERKTEIFGCF